MTGERARECSAAPARMTDERAREGGVRLGEEVV